MKPCLQFDLIKYSHLKVSKKLTLRINLTSRFIYYYLSGSLYFVSEKVKPFSIDISQFPVKSFN